MLTKPLKEGVIDQPGSTYLATWLAMLVAFLGAFVFTPSVQAKSFSIPKNGEVYLITIGLGQAVYTRYGHTVLRIVDLDSKADHNLNWGIFDYDNQLSFGFVFFKGILTYRLGNYNYGGMHYHYTKRENRSMVQNKLHLTAKQKNKLFQLVATNLQPENITYHYQYFFANCATIIRDYIDQVLHGKVKETYQDQLTTKTFRDYIRDNLNSPPIIVFGLDMVMNSRIDYPLSKWQEMFYPLKLQQYLAELKAVDDDGHFTSTALLGNDEIIHRGKTYESSSLDSFLVFFGASMLLLLLSWLLYWRYNSRILFGLLSIFWGVFAAFLSVLMLFSWAYSEHLDLHHNANLWLFWPSDILFVYVGLKVMLKRSFSGGQGFLRFYFLAHMCCWGVLVGMRVLGVVEQNVDAVLWYISPLLIVCSAASYRTLSSSSSGANSLQSA